MNTLPRCTLVVVNHNGRTLLEQCLPSVERAVKAADGACDLLVADNGSRDDSMAFLQRHYSAVRVLPLDSNRGFGYANNAAIRTCSTPLVMCLNNDVELADDSLVRLLECFGDEQVFSATPQILRRSHGLGNEAIPVLREKEGLIVAEVPGLADPARRWPEPLEIPFGHGAATIYRRERFLELGGFDPIFHPIYWEDVDLGYNACKRGWRNLYVPAASVVHYGGATVGVGPSRARERADRFYLSHQILFAWKNIVDPAMVARHRRSFLSRLSKAICQGRWRRLRVLLRALARYPIALRRRRVANAGRLLSDAELLASLPRPTAPRG